MYKSCTFEEVGGFRPYAILTPKGPACVFWQHRNFGWVHVIGELHILG